MRMGCTHKCDHISTIAHGTGSVSEKWWLLHYMTTTLTHNTNQRQSYAPYVCFHVFGYVKVTEWPPIGKIAAHSAYDCFMV